MDNQHRKIKGYRELSQAEIDLMNKIKAHAETTRQLCEEVRQHVIAQRSMAYSSAADPGEQARLDSADPLLWQGAGTHGLQLGFMQLTRAVAQPTTF